MTRLVGVFDVRPDGGKPPRFLHQPESLYELYNVGLSDCLNEVLFLDNNRFRLLSLFQMMIRALRSK